MAHSTFVNVLDSSDHLLVDPYCRLFVESLMFHNVVEQLTIGAILHNQVKLCFSLYNLKWWEKFELPRKVGWRWGAELFLEFWSPSRFFRCLFYLWFALFPKFWWRPEQLQRITYRFTCQRMHTKLHLTERSLAQWLSEYIRAQFSTVSMLIILVVAGIACAVILCQSRLFFISFR